MKAALITGREQVDFAEFPLPEKAGPGTAVVEIGRTGICGSDVSAFKDGHDYPPFLSGHEWGGAVLDVGEGVADLAVGDRVVAGTPPACGRCAMCRAGHAQRCEGLTALSFGTHPLTPAHGAYAERITVPAEMLIRLPDGVDDDQAAMIEPATVALHAVRRRPPLLGETAVVMGAGPVGLFAVQLLRLSGTGRVVVVEPRQRRRGLALELGADAAVAPGAEAAAAVQHASGGLGADLVFDCAGNEAALTAAVELCRPGATIMMLGVASGSVSVSPLAWLSKELTVQTSLAHLNHEFTVTADLIASGRLRTEPLHDATVGLTELPRALADLAAGQDHVKVLVDPRA
ncbi:galactitol-1-phosphate 5-dehydrogenase [Nocardiopsis tropica]|uniref:zinc-dependent alcohol dehydrogenase n=1 Tax=Nocardiopsis tropica TaxID=109330 RepID=UPI0031CE095B